MKLTNPDVVLHKRGVQESNQYQIAQSAKMMKMLADSLYKDKIKAPIRELSTNAWDAHVMAGNTDTVPVMHLPNHSDPEFRIRDFGTGMSPEDLMEMYQTYGASNKSDSNNYNGCMGIGSKSPFAYSSSFTTTSFWNGMKYVYINAKGEDGIPTINLFHSEPTDEPNGLQISFAVKPTDFHIFKMKAQEVLRWFPKMFDVSGGHNDFLVQVRKYAMEGNGWKIRSDTNESCAIMGNVEYPIEKTHFSSDKKKRDNDWYKYYDKTPFIRLLNLGLELHFDIGEVEMDISREGLQYNTQTVKTIQLRLQAVLDEIAKQVQKEFDDCDNLWDARILLFKLERGELRGIRQLIELAKLEFEGQDLTSNIQVNYPEFTLISFYKGRRVKPKRENVLYKISANDKDLFYLADMERGNYSAIERVFEQDPQGTHNANIYLVKPLNCTPIKEVRKKFIEVCGMKDKHLKNCSDVPKPPKDKRKQRVVNVFELAKDKPSTLYGSYHRNYQKMFWNDTTIDFKEGGLFLEVNAWQVVKEGGVKTKPEKILEVVSVLQTLGVQVPKIYGVKTAVVGKYQKSKKWTNFLDWAKEKLRNHIQKTNVTTKLSDLETLDNFNGSQTKLQNIVENSSEKIKDSKNLILILLDKLAALDKIRKTWQTKLKNIQRVCYLLDIQQPKGKADSTLNDLVAQVDKKYEVLDLVDSWDAKRERVASKVVRIINLVDSCSKDEE